MVEQCRMSGGKSLWEWGRCTETFVNSDCPLAFRSVLRDFADDACVLVMTNRMSLFFWNIKACPRSLSLTGEVKVDPLGNSGAPWLV